jgi:hypothetical protein
LVNHAYYFGLILIEFIFLGYLFWILNKSVNTNEMLCKNHTTDIIEAQKK